MISSVIYMKFAFKRANTPKRSETELVDADFFGSWKVNSQDQAPCLCGNFSDRRVVRVCSDLINCLLENFSCQSARSVLCDNYLQ